MKYILSLAELDQLVVAEMRRRGVTGAVGLVWEVRSNVPPAEKLRVAVEEITDQPVVPRGLRLCK